VRRSWHFVITTSHNDPDGGDQRVTYSNVITTQGRSTPFERYRRINEETRKRLDVQYNYSVLFYSCVPNRSR
jgi:hypothetical protein